MRTFPILACKAESANVLQRCQVSEASEAPGSCSIYLDIDELINCQDASKPLMCI